MAKNISSKRDFVNSPMDAACELVSLLYESLRQADARSAFRQGLARQLGAEIQSIVFFSRSDGSLATYGSATEPEAFALQSCGGTAPLPASLVGEANGLTLCSMSPSPRSDAKNRPGDSVWLLLWNQGPSLVQLAINSADLSFEPAAFIEAQRDFLDCVMPHVGAAYSIFRKQQLRTPRLNGVRALHAMLPLPLVMASRQSHSLVPNTQALRLMIREAGPRHSVERAQTTRAAEQSSGWSVQHEAGLVRSIEGESGERLALAQLNGLGLNSPDLGYQVHLLHGQPGSAAAVNPALLAACFGINAAEADLCACAMAGKNPQAIAEDLGLPINTVKSRLRTIYRRLGVSSVAQLLSRLYFHPAYWAANYGQHAQFRMAAPEENR